MLKALEFVKGAIAKQQYSSVLTHFSIAGGRIRGFNGWVALCSPIPLDLDAAPKAESFIKAIEACKDVAQLSKTPAGQLVVRSGDLTVHIECLGEAFPAIYPEGVLHLLGGNILPALKTLAPFMADDNIARQWAAGVLLRGQSAFATNNVVAVEYWLGTPLPEVSISRHAVRELLRIGEEPLSVQVSDRSVTFHYPGDRWARAQNNPGSWPNLGQIIECDSEVLAPVTNGFFDAIERLQPFANAEQEIHFVGDSLSTEKQLTQGASVTTSGLPSHQGCYNIKQLLKLRDIATHFAFTLDGIARFCGPNLRGAIAGMQPT